MTLWIGNGAVLKSSSQGQLNEFLKLNNSVHELFIFKILLIAIDWKGCIEFYEKLYPFFFKQPLTDGFVAIVMPKLKDFAGEMAKLRTKEEYMKTTNTNIT